MLRNFQNLEDLRFIQKWNGCFITFYIFTVGLDILKKGGNAVDSAIAMALVLPLCEPQSTGYFGDVFCIISQPNIEKYIGINGSGKSANKENSKILKSKGHKKIPETDISTITLPGAMKAFENIHDNFGNLDLKELCNPAIYYAKSGIIVSPRVAFDWQHL